MALFMFIVFMTSLSMVYAFNLPTRGMFSGLSELESLVTSRAVFSTITEQVKNEIISDSPFMKDISHGYFRLDSDVCYLALIGIAIYSKMNSDSVTNQKLNNISMYSRTMRVTRSILFTFIVILTKNVDNAI
jgi:hypothetical protein